MMSRRLELVWEWISDTAGRTSEILAEQFALTFDRERFATAVSLGDRLAAVSWPRAGVMAGFVGAVVVGGVILARHDALRPHPPALPTDHEVQVGQDAIKSFMDGRPDFAVTPPQSPTHDRPEPESN